MITGCHGDAVTARPKRPPGPAAGPSAAPPATAPGPQGRAAGLLAASVTVVAWASAFVAIRMAVRSFPPQEVAFLRFLSAAVALVALGAVRRMPLPAPRDLPALALLGLVGHAAYNLLLAAGQAKVPAATAAFVISSAPLWMALWAFTRGLERPAPLGLAGMAASFGGVALIAVGRGGALALEPAALVVLAASVLQAAYSMGTRPLLARYTPLQVSTFTVGAALLWLAPFGPGALRRLTQAPWGDGAAALYLGVVPTAIGYSTWAVAMKRLAPSAAGAFLFVVPAAVVVMAWGVLGEWPAPLTLAGGALVAAGVIVVQRRRRR